MLYVKFSLGAAGVLLGAMLAFGMPRLEAAQRGNATIDLSDPQQLLEAYIRTVGDTSGKTSISYGSGTVYAYVPGERPQALFGLEVVGAGRYLKIEGGYQRLHREIGFYTDLKTGEIIEKWFNPYIQREVSVIPIQNDPVNRRFTVQNQNYRVMETGKEIMFWREVPLRYKNPLDPAAYPLYSSGEWYEAMEMFNNFTEREYLENRRLTSVPATGSWTRFGPWLPWMEMGRHQGYLIYHSRSVKPRNGVQGLPPKLRDYIAKHYPKYLESPDTLVEPDETSWTFFKKKLDERTKGGAQ